MTENEKMIFVIVLLVATFSIAYALNFLPLVIILGLVLLQKTLMDSLVFPAHLGVDISFFALILAGMIYGPLFGFVFGMVVIPFFGVVRAILEMPILEGLNYLTPSFASFIVGMAGLLAGFMAGRFPFLAIIFVTVFIKNIALALQTFIMENKLFIQPAHVLSIVTTTFIAFVLEREGIIEFILSLA